MRSDTHWLLHFCFEHELLTEGQLTGLVGNLDPDTDASTCANMLSKSGWVKDQAFLDSAVDSARTNAREGFPAPALPGGIGGDVPGVAGLSLPDFSSLEAMSDDDLRRAMEALFENCQSVGVSDLHITAGARPRVRHHRKLIYLSSETLPAELAERMNLVLLNESQKTRFQERQDLSYALSFGERSDGCRMRFRANLLNHSKGISGVYRIIANRLNTLEGLGFPNADVIRKLLSYHNGILLVTGPAGSGKTTTLASMVHELNQTRQEHIITLEDPIEVMQDSENCIVTQRQVKTHTQSFQSALQSALREDPDIIVIGEMRDLETIEMAVTAAETGHLVIATMHTRDAASTLNRLLDVFPASQQNQIRATVAGSLRGILCQRLLPSTDDEVVLACELLVNTTAVSNIIREAKDTGLESAMQTGRRQGMRTLNESLDALLAEGKISEDVAQENRIASDVKSR